MTDRIARPPVRLRGGMPDGNLSGAGDVSGHFLKAEPDNRFAIVELARRQLVHDDETGGDVAVLGVVAIEFPDQEFLARMLQEHRDVRMGTDQLPFPEPAATSDADKARELERRIEAHFGDGARAEWVDYFGPGDKAPVGPRGAGLPYLMEFVGERKVPPVGLDAALLEEPAPDDDGDDDLDDYTDDDELDGDGDDRPRRRDVVDVDLPDEDQPAGDDGAEEMDDDAGHGDAKVMQFSGR